MTDQVTSQAFDAQRAAYKTRIEADIAAYATHVHRTTRQQYGAAAGEVTDVFLDLLQAPGKRLRGMLVLAGYELCDGTDTAMITRAATAIEMLHTYILMIDDIQDRSRLRRGKPTAHVELAERYRGKAVDPEHMGLGLALNAACSGAHAAQTLLSSLSVDPQLRANALGIVNQAMIVTAHGQTYDLIHELGAPVSDAELERTAEWKTAYYSFLNPLCVGMVLAGAGCEDTDAIREYALAAGKAFQLTDDIMGTFGDERHTGKDAMGDIREGKRTALTTYALTHLDGADRDFLRQALGNEALATDVFVRVKQLLTQSGARAHAEQLAEGAIDKAVRALDREAHRWQAGPVSFLGDLVRSFYHRAQ